MMLPSCPSVVDRPVNLHHASQDLKRRAASKFRQFSGVDAGRRRREFQDDIELLASRQQHEFLRVESGLGDGDVARLVDFNRARRLAFAKPFDGDARAGRRRRHGGQRRPGSFAAERERLATGERERRNRQSKNSAHAYPLTAPIAAKPRSRSAVRSSISSSPAWRRRTGPSSVHFVAVLLFSGWTWMHRLSKPPQEKPMPNSFGALKNAFSAGLPTGLRITPKSPEAPAKSRFQIV